MNRIAQVCLLLFIGLNCASEETSMPAAGEISLPTDRNILSREGRYITVDELKRMPEFESVRGLLLERGVETRSLAVLGGLLTDHRLFVIHNERGLCFVDEKKQLYPAVFGLHPSYDLLARCENLQDVLKLVSGDAGNPARTFVEDVNYLVANFGPEIGQVGGFGYTLALAAVDKSGVLLIQIDVGYRDDGKQKQLTTKFLEKTIRLTLVTGFQY
jgi:hypothetical protein